MSFLTSSLFIESGAWMLGSTAGNALLQQTIPELQRDWNENIICQSPSLKQKILFLAPQIFLVSACLYLYSEAPELCTIFFKKHHAVALNMFQGFLVASTLRLGDFVIKKANRNHTPNQEIRKKSILMLSIITTMIYIAGTILRISYEKILFAQVIVDRTIQHLYDFNPKAADDVTSMLSKTPPGLAAVGFEKYYEEKRISATKYGKQKLTAVTEASKQHLSEARDQIHRKVHRLPPSKKKLHPDVAPEDNETS